MANINNKQMEMIGQMFNYLHNAIDSDIIDGQDLNNLLMMKDASKGEIELGTEQGRTVKKMVDYFMKKTSKEEFHTLTGYDFVELIELNNKFN
jgi:hypothetical protein